MFSLMNLKMWTLTALTLLSKTVSFHKEQTYFAFLKIESLRRTSSPTRPKVTVVAPYKVVTSSQDLADIDISKNYVLKTATGGYDGHGQKVIRSEADLEEAYALADSADCVLEEFVNFGS